MSRDRRLDGPPLQPVFLTGRGQPPHVARLVARLARSRFLFHLYRGDPAPFSREPSVRRLIRNRLGWVGAPGRMLREVPRLQEFARRAWSDGVRQVVLLGMGGSSLCVEVFRGVFPAPADRPEILVLDSTVPETVRDVSARLDLSKTLFVVSSKSGTTLETAVLQSFFWARMRRERGRHAGGHFVAITDPGTPLSSEAASRRYRGVFHNAPDIGGRYSALTYFGLVPAALGGVDIGEILRRAAVMEKRCGEATPPDVNPGLLLGAVLGAQARQGRDKVLLIVDPALQPFALWIEQLLAESTGKNGRGLVPVAAPPSPSALADALRGNDRQAVALVVRGSAAAGPLLRRAPLGGAPAVAIALEDRLDLGACMQQWEIATAVAGSVLGVNPFDEPNVAESKKNTEEVLSGSAAGGRLEEGIPTLVDGRARVFLAGTPSRALRGKGSRGGLRAALRALLERPAPGDYVAVLAYVDTRSPALRARLEAIRSGLLRRTRRAATWGFGPRYLHSTGQLHKGGPGGAIALEIVPDDRGPLAIPGKPYDFETLKQAQALGDYLSLRRRGRRVLRLRHSGDAAAALRSVLAALQGSRRPGRG